MPDIKIEITAEIVDTALDAWFEPQWRDASPAGFITDYRRDMRAALTAAFALVTPGAGFRAGAEWAAGMAERKAEGMSARARGGLGSMFANQSSTDLREHAAAIRTALAAMPEGGDGWNPIETHPGDTKSCLIAGKYPNGVAYVEEQFLHHDGHWNSRRLEPPTHWQPMPSPPSTQGV